MVGSGYRDNKMTRRHIQSNVIDKFLPDIRTTLREATELPTSQSAPAVLVATDELRL